MLPCLATLDLTDATCRDIVFHRQIDTFLGTRTDGADIIIGQPGFPLRGTSLVDGNTVAARFQHTGAKPVHVVCVAQVAPLRVSLATINGTMRRHLARDVRNIPRDEGLDRSRLRNGAWTGQVVKHSTLPNFPHQLLVMPQPDIAAIAQEPANLAGVVAVIDHPMTSLDGAAAMLFGSA